MINQFQILMNNYLNWLRQSIELKESNGWIEITTPFLDRHNDAVQIYARESDGKYELSDDGNTIADLEMSGFSFSNSAKRQDLLTLTLNGFGISRLDYELRTVATEQTFAQKKHNLIQAILAVNDLFFLSSPAKQNLFYEDVVNWFDFSDIRYTPRIKFAGKAGYDHMFDFVVPKSKKQPERIIQTLNSPTKNSVEILTFSWLDIKDTRPENAKLFAIVNDSDVKVNDSVVDALKNYEITPGNWSEREVWKEILAA